jgi:hypothetical protein
MLTTRPAKPQFTKEVEIISTKFCLVLNNGRVDEMMRLYLSTLTHAYVISMFISQISFINPVLTSEKRHCAAIIFAGANALCWTCFCAHSSVL